MGDLLKSLKNQRFFNDFHGLGASLLDRKAVRNWCKNEVESKLAGVMDSGLIFHRFWLDFGFQNHWKINFSQDTNSPREGRRTLNNEQKNNKTTTGGGRNGYAYPSRRLREPHSDTEASPHGHPEGPHDVEKQCAELLFLKPPRATPSRRG